MFPPIVVYAESLPDGFHDLVIHHYHIVVHQSRMISHGKEPCTARRSGCLSPGRHISAAGVDSAAEITWSQSNAWTCIFEATGSGGHTRSVRMGSRCGGENRVPRHGCRIGSSRARGRENVSRWRP